MKFLKYSFAVSLLFSGIAWGEPSTTGQTGLINMPDARIDPDGTWRIGVSKAEPYVAGWTSVSMSFLEVSGRYTAISGTSSQFQSEYWKNYGNYKDKTFDAKLVLLNETKYLPNLAVGIQDFQGTGIFNARYVTASKRLDNFDFTLGSGNKRIDGLFGGVRYYPAGFKHIALVAEYDAYDYNKDI